MSIGFQVGSAYQKPDDPRFRLTPWYYQLRNRCYWIRDRISDIFAEKNLKWDSAIDELVERLVSMDGLISSERINRAIVRRMVVVEDKVNELLKENAHRICQKITICQDNHVAVHFMDGHVDIIDADFAVRTTRVRHRRTTQEDLEYTLKHAPSVEDIYEE